jgi:glycosyltransferase involved in cell wall biosynthesis
MRKQITIIVPIHNETEFLRPFYYNLIQHVPKDEFELIWVNNASNDSTFSEIQELMRLHPSIRCVSLKQKASVKAAILAGMDYSEGQWIVVMRGDLQHPASALKIILEQLYNGCDIVDMRINNTKTSSFLKRTCFNLLYRLIDKVNSPVLLKNIDDFKGYRRDVVKDILFTQRNQFFIESFFNWSEYRIKVIPYENKKCKSQDEQYSYAHLYSQLKNILGRSEPGILKTFSRMGITLTGLGMITFIACLFFTITQKKEISSFLYIGSVAIMLAGFQLKVYSTYRKELKTDLFEYSRSNQYLIDHVYDNREEIRKASIQKETKILRKVS